MMIEVRVLTELKLNDLRRVASGYCSDSKYVVAYTESQDQVSFDLQLTALEKPFSKTYDHFDAETLERYDAILEGGYSFGAYDGGLLVGLVIAEARLWNHSLSVNEFHVTATHRNSGIGKRLMEAVTTKALRAGLRTIVCETQNTNAVAIQVYRKLGFTVEGIDISYYSNADFPDGEIAVFMKKRLR
jgi:ribosomal protein S18 acetylase RimI-like enzyme